MLISENKTLYTNWLPGQTPEFSVYPGLQAVHSVLPSLQDTQLSTPSAHAKTKTTIIYFLIIIYVKERTGCYFNHPFMILKWYVFYCAVPSAQKSQGASHFTSLEDQFNQFLWEASSHMLQLMRERWSNTYHPLSIAMYSFTQRSELEQNRIKQLPQCLNTNAQDSKPVPISQETEDLRLSPCAQHH